MQFYLDGEKRLLAFSYFQVGDIVNFNIFHKLDFQRTFTSIYV